MNYGRGCVINMGSEKRFELHSKVKVFLISVECTGNISLFAFSSQPGMATAENDPIRASPFTDSGTPLITAGK